MLELSNINLVKNNLFNNLSFCLEDNCSVCVFGDEDEGKTLLAEIIVGISNIKFNGEVKFENEKLNTKTTKCVYLPKVCVLFENKSVLDNICYAFEVLKIGNKKNRKEMASSHLKKFGWDTSENFIVKNLSEFQKKKLCLVRALVKMPKILVCDDLFANYEKKQLKELEKLLKEFLCCTKIFFDRNPINYKNVVQKFAHLHFGKIDRVGLFVDFSKIQNSAYILKSFHPEFVFCLAKIENGELIFENNKIILKDEENSVLLKEAISLKSLCVVNILGEFWVFDDISSECLLKIKNFSN